MRKLLISVLLLIALVIPVGVQAQAPINIESLQVAFWPEYDRPEVLILYNIQLPAGTPLPASLSFRIPASVGQPNAVAESVGGRLVNAEYTSVTDGEWITLNITATSLSVHLEYYDASLVKSGDTRSFAFEWLGDHPVNSLRFNVQQPAEGTNMEFSLPVNSPINQDGLNYYLSEAGQFRLGQTSSFSFSYEKPNDTLTIQSAIPEEPETTEPTPLSQQIDIQWVLGGIAIVLIIVGVYNLLRSDKPKRRPSKRQKAKSRKVAGKRQTSGNVFCHNCGNAGDKADQFCRNCGEKLRR